MKYRLLGSTGLIVSEIGLGCEGFSGRDEAFTCDMFNRAIERGVNCMDLYSPDPDLRRRVGRALRGRRERFVIQAHLCTVWEKDQYRVTRKLSETAASFEDLLTALETDYIDIGMIHYVDSEALWRQIAGGPVMEYLLSLKAQGKVCRIGVSSHNPLAALRAVESGLVEVLMFSVNPCYDLLPATENCEDLWAEESYSGTLRNMDPDRRRLYEVCQRRGVGLTVMKAFGGGDLLTSASPAGVALTVPHCLHYALTRPAAATVFAGVHSAEQLEACLAYENASDTEKDYAAALAAFPRISWQGHCMYCGHCAPCPAGIDVAAVTRFYHLARAQGGPPETVRGHYEALAHTADECIECGQCESRCPFDVPIRETMRAAARMFTR